MTTYFPQCMNCSRFRVADRTAEKCSAFPEGIPERILQNKIDHREPVVGDHGLQYLPLNPATPHPMESIDATQS